MPLPDIKFAEIRRHNSNQANAFEELCCQLAQDETLARPRVRFDRKGAGGDGGVECYATLDDGSEVGWQVKYYNDVARALKSASESLAKALDKHPAMDRFVVCLPLDLSDSRKDDVVTAAAKWTAWKEREIAAALAQGRTIEIDRWDSFELKNRLTTSSPAAAGRIAFWFDKTLFTDEWFEARFTRVRDSLKARYVPETHVNLPIRKSLLATVRDPSLFDDLVDLREAVEDRWRACDQDDADSGTAIQAALEAFSVAIDRNNTVVPIDTLRTAVEAARQAVSLWHCGQRQPLTGQPATLEALAPISNLLSELQTVDLVLRQAHWDHLNAQALLVLGEAGTGKSHLLADACAHQIGKGAPAIMILGGKLPDEDPWAAILRDLDLASGLTTQQFLSALNAAGQAAGVRALIALDALNEKNGQAIWPGRLAGLLYDARQYPWISVVLSCRTTYEDVVISGDLDETELPRVTHQGFSLGEARRYLARRGISLTEAPNHVEEFGNPLFLKICCDALKLLGEALLPGGLGSVTAVFGLYTEAVAEEVRKTLGAVKSRSYPQTALKALAMEMATTGRGEIPLSRANALVDPIYAGGTVGKDLLFELQAEGMLTEDPADALTSEPVIRFTFERMGDHAIAAELLARSVTGSSAATACQSGTALEAALTLPRSRIKWGLMEALAVQLPERYALELQDLPGLPKSGAIPGAFAKSLLSRKSDALTARTWQLVDQAGDASLRYETLIAISTDPGHPYNAEYLDQQLRSLSMPERDAVWSTHVALPRHAQAQKLIDWARQADPKSIHSERALLSGLVFTWCLTTSSRTIRDTATKALVAVLADHPGVAATLWTRFKDVADGYLTERLVAAIYGAALQGRWTEVELRQIVDQLYADLFAAGAPPANILLRDHAHRLVQFAWCCDALSDRVDVARTTGSFVSPWPLEFVSDETIASYARTYADRGSGRDEIVGSCFDGDFARYQLDYAVDGWSAAPLGAASIPTRTEVAQAWLDDFEASATPEALAAYETLRTELTATDATTSFSGRRSQAKAEKDAFKEAVGELGYAEWQAKAENWRKKGMYQNAGPSKDLAQFNLDWARRWVCKRAHDLGWSEALHGAFDLTIRNDRMTHKCERIGKKYQWLALYELCARMADNLALLPGEAIDEAIERLRNIDPSMLRAATADDGWRRFDGPSFWVPQTPDVAPASVEEALAWLRTDKDVLDGADTIEVTNPEDESAWLVLTGFESWRAKGDGLARDAWRRVGSFVVDKSEADVVLARLAKYHLQGDHDIPRGRRGDTDGSYLGEHPWVYGEAEPLRERDQGQIWVRSETGRALPPLEVLPTTVSYLAESTGYDASIDENINLLLPAAWLMQEMGLQLSDGATIEYIDAAGIVRFMDPSVAMEGRSAGLIDRDTFLAFLAAKDLVAIWAVAGEKNVYGGSYSDGFGGRYTFTRLFVSDGDKIVGHTRYETFEPPTPSQLAALTGDEADKNEDSEEAEDEDGTDFEAILARIGALDEDDDWDDEDNTSGPT